MRRRWVWEKFVPEWYGTRVRRAVVVRTVLGGYAFLEFEFEIAASRVGVRLWPPAGWEGLIDAAIAPARMASYYITYEDRVP